MPQTSTRVNGFTKSIIRSMTRLSKTHKPSIPLKFSVILLLTSMEHRFHLGWEPTNYYG